MKGNSSLLFLLLFAYVLVEGSFDPLLVLAFSLLHELGHWLALRRFGKKPCLSCKGQGFALSVGVLSYRQELWVAFCGPAVSLGLAMVFGALYGVWKREFFAFCALTNGALGLLNLLPIYPLDGGRILNACLGLFCPLSHQRTVSAAVAMIFLFPLLALAFWQFLQSGYNVSLLMVCIYLLYLMKESLI